MKLKIENHKRIPINLKSIVTIFLIIVIIFSSFYTMYTYAHPGRTDSEGGHRDNNNVSGLGSYHYHHGEPPHLHENGICSYDNNKNTPTESNDTIKKEVITKENTENINEKDTDSFWDNFINILIVILAIYFLIGVIINTK